MWRRTKTKQTSTHNDTEQTCTVDSIKAYSSLRETQQTSMPLLDPIGKTEKRKRKKYIKSCIMGAKTKANTNYVLN